MHHTVINKEYLSVHPISLPVSAVHQCSHQCTCQCSPSVQPSLYLSIQLISIPVSASISVPVRAGVQANTDIFWKIDFCFPFPIYFNSLWTRLTFLPSNILQTTQIHPMPVCFNGDVSQWRSLNCFWTLRLTWGLLKNYLHAYWSTHSINHMPIYSAVMLKVTLWHDHTILAYQW